MAKIPSENKRYYIYIICFQQDVFVNDALLREHPFQTIKKEISKEKESAFKLGKEKRKNIRDLPLMIFPKVV